MIFFRIRTRSFLQFLRIEISDGSGGFLSSKWASGLKSPDDWGRMLCCVFQENGGGSDVNMGPGNARWTNTPHAHRCMVPKIKLSTSSNASKRTRKEVLGNIHSKGVDFEPLKLRGSEIKREQSLFERGRKLKGANNAIFGSGGRKLKGRKLKGA